VSFSENLDNIEKISATGLLDWGLLPTTTNTTKNFFEDYPRKIYHFKTYFAQILKFIQIWTEISSLNVP